MGARLRAELDEMLRKERLRESEHAVSNEELDALRKELARLNADRSATEKEMRKLMISLETAESSRKSQIEGLQQKLDNANEDINRMRKEKKEVVTTNSDLNKVIEGLEKEINRLKEELGRSIDDVKRMKKELSVAHSQYENNLNSLTESSRNSSLSIEDLLKQIKDLKVDISRLEKTNVEVSKELIRLKGEKEDLKESHAKEIQGLESKLQRNVRESKLAIETAGKQADELKDLLQKSMADNRSLTIENSESKAEIESLLSNSKGADKNISETRVTYVCSFCQNAKKPEEVKSPSKSVKESPKRQVKKVEVPSTTRSKRKVEEIEESNTQLAKSARAETTSADAIEPIRAASKPGKLGKGSKF